MYLFQKVRKEIAEPTVAQADLGGSIKHNDVKIKNQMYVKQSDTRKDIY